MTLFDGLSQLAMIDVTYFHGTAVSKFLDCWTVGRNLFLLNYWKWNAKFNLRMSVGEARLVGLASKVNSSSIAHIFHQKRTMRSSNYYTAH